MSELHVPKIAILASGSGTTADALAHDIHNGKVSAEIGLVIASKHDAGILDKAKKWNEEFGFDVRTKVINQYTHPGFPQERGQTLQEAEVICDLVESGRFSLVALLGYMRQVNGVLVDEYGYLPGTYISPYQARMINTHPGELPLTEDTYGMATSAVTLDAYNQGLVTKGKHTVHVVSPGMDKGPVIAEHDVQIKSDDTAESLNERTQWIEKATIGYATDMFLRDQRAWHETMQL